MAEQIVLKKNSKKPPFERFYPYVVFLFLGFCLADLAMIPLRGSMLPTQVPPSRPKRFNNEGFVSASNFASVTTRNIFSKDGTIPETLAQRDRKAKGEEVPDSAPVPSSLPLNLVGTIVHSNPEKSIADIELKSKSTVIAVRVGKDIDKLATLISVERGKVIIRNLNNQRLEFIEIKSLNKLAFAAAKTVAPVGKQEVMQVAPNKFEIKRSDVLKYTADLSSVLQQAAMQPHHGPNGEIDGFKFLSIQPNTIYTQLGFQVGDVIKGVNGNPVTSPAEAMQMYQAMKNSSTINMSIERDGRVQDMNYNVK